MVESKPDKAGGQLYSYTSLYVVSGQELYVGKCALLLEMMWTMKMQVNDEWVNAILKKQNLEESSYRQNKRNVFNRIEK